MDIVLGVFLGVALWFFTRYGIGGFYTVGPNERAVLCTFGRAQRIDDEATTLSDPVADKFTAEERQRYATRRCAWSGLAFTGSCRGRRSTAPPLPPLLFPLPLIQKIHLPIPVAKCWRL